MLRLSLFLALLTLAPVMRAPVALAQPADTLVTAAEALPVRFEDARALAVDPAGRLFVVDAGRNVVHQLDAAGALVASLGGTGTQAGAFDEPTDIDPTNGLVLLVADAGNSRIQRFSRQYLYLGSIPVGRGEGNAGQPSYRSRESEVADFADGRPVALITTNADELFAIESTQGIVLKWDRDGRLARVIGSSADGFMPLDQPVALAADERSLYVADRGLAAVVVYDAFGAYIRTLAEGRAVDVRAVAVHRERLWIVLPERLLVYQQGRLERTLDVRLGEPLIDVAVANGFVYLLTRTRLYRMLRMR